MVLSSAGQRCSARRRVAPPAVTVTAKGSTGQTLSFVIHLARWVWHWSSHAEGGGRVSANADAFRAGQRTVG